MVFSLIDTGYIKFDFSSEAPFYSYIDGSKSNISLKLNSVNEKLNLRKLASAKIA